VEEEHTALQRNVVRLVVTVKDQQSENIHGKPGIFKENEYAERAFFIG
jgi:hypothetical protein